MNFAAVGNGTNISLETIVFHDISLGKGDDFDIPMLLVKGHRLSLQLLFRASDR